jgi:hypothetical protein
MAIPTTMRSYSNNTVISLTTFRRNRNSMSTSALKSEKDSGNKRKIASILTWLIMTKTIRKRSALEATEIEIYVSC